MTSYESLSKRQDLFLRYGPYGLPALLLKVAKPYPVSITTWQSAEPMLVTTDIAHVGGRLLDLTSPAFTSLDAWISNGHAVNNAPAGRARARANALLQQRRHRSGFRPHARTRAAGFRDLRQQRQPRARQELRGRQLPRLRRQLAVPDLRHTPEAAALELLRGRRLRVGRHWRERDPASRAVARGGRRVPRGRHHLRDHR